ncbi:MULTISPECIES: type II toxin-antitoxin system RelB/DinJ family antitoxin [Lactobacillus]|jgi:addiction module antitoxin, relB/dinJ family|uniref:Type II toxin-antitoxin system RelB/DinJ family antitoxin n=1 Tax=Lactobacillus jensenii TaxID=109790 RepID=A0ABU9FFS3_LACJE|nr:MULTISPECIES: type II toxin-antitoxin system RelB/DinJ family antitoxin [Lactobacillus]KAA9235562.1 type II toxin-antitoxin system RelB/DinJ family antitoxin [Lactobacillus jensenii]KAA9263856.1 type II toxin-antitoxin system RelB/DinJ family antitoxin [Lactobacillus jensenii]MCF1797272.1 type II toxin-antitoxin system RelB/DinJ family antitoxin [Lactobacillus mulieris]MCF1846893.1 type II toxin-antitoxin system RelB/DinJ family antitoxin [Lactobacillus mulieris]MCF1851609.1 type II toxin-a
MATKTYSTRVNEQDHDEAVQIFNDLGMDWSTGIRIYLKSVIKNKGIPFSLSQSEILSPELEKSIEQSLEEYKKGNYQTVHSVDELFDQLDK